MEIPRPRELTRIEENFRRFRDAMFACYVAAWVLYAIVTLHWNLAHPTRQHLASLGLATWTVGFALMCITAYYATQRRRVAAR